MKPPSSCHPCPLSRAVLMAALCLTQVTAQPLPVAPPEDDIRPPREAIVIPPPRPSQLRRNLILASLVAGCGAAVWFWMRRSHPKLPPVTPLDEARASLGQINAQREDITAGELAELTANVVRRFVAGNFGIAAPQRTTEEFLHSLTTGGASPLLPHVELLQGFLITCDKAKFSGTDFDPVERYALIETAGRFVQAAAYTAPSIPSSPA